MSAARTRAPSPSFTTLPVPEITPGNRVSVAAAGLKTSDAMELTIATSPAIEPVVVPSPIWSEPETMEVSPE